MNARIEELTRTYLDSLNLSRYTLDDNQKQNIIRINNQTDWIIFNASSLRSHYSTGQDKIYDINSPYLRELLKEQIKTYHEGDWRETFFSPDSDEYNNASINDIEIKFFQWYRSERISTGRYDWIAAKKSAMGGNFGNLMMDIKEVDLATGVLNRKVGELNNLLNDPEIQNTTAPSMNNNGQGRTRPSEETEVPPPPSNENNHHDNSSHSSSSITRTIQFKVKSVWKHEDVNFFEIEPDSPITVNGKRVSLVEITGRKVNSAYQNGDLRVGNTISITNIRFSLNQFNACVARINAYNELSIGKKSYDEIRVVSSTTSSSTPPPTSFPPETEIPTFFPEVRQKNQELNGEEDKMDSLAKELSKIIEDNDAICQEAQQLGLSFPKIPVEVLDYFQEESFIQLDENQSLNNLHNSKIKFDNENIRKKKLNIKKNIYDIYNNNKKKLAKGKSSTLPPKNELEKLKEEVKGKINKVLTDKDNLRNINLIVLANGKYQSWERDIEGLTSEDEVIVFVESFLTALKEKGAEEKGQEEKKKSNKTSSNNPQILPKKTLINVSTKKAINNLSLPTAKNFAKNKVRELFKQYKPDLEKIKKVWGEEKSWMTYLEKCDSPEKIVAFLEKLEKEIIHQSLNQERNDNKKSPFQNSWIIPSLTIIFLVSLVIIIVKMHYNKRRKIK